MASVTQGLDRSSAPAPPAARDDRLPQEPGWNWADLLRGLLPLVLAVPVVLGFIATLHGLAGTPYLGEGDSAALDGQAFWLGEPLFRSPNAGYSDMGYTPLLAVLSGVLEYIDVWRGWPAVINAFWLAAFAGFGAWLAWARPAANGLLFRAVALVEALAIGVVVYWLLSSGQATFLFVDRPEAAAWVPALGGLVLLPWAARGSRGAAIAFVALITIGFWTKQTTLVVPAVGTLWLALAALVRLVPWRRVLTLSAWLLAVNVVVMGVLNLVTNGWAFYFNFLQARKQPCCELSTNKVQYLRIYTREFASTSIFALVFAAVMLAIAAVAVTVAIRRGALTEGRLAALQRLRPQTLALTALLLYLPIGYLTAGYARANYGSAINQAFGVTAALGLAAAAAYGVARANATLRWVRIAAVAALAFGAWNVDSRELWGFLVRVPHPGEAVGFNSIPPDIAALGKTDKLVYHPLYSDISVKSRHQIYPDWMNLTAYLGVGDASGSFARAVNERRFDIVFPFSDDQINHPLTSGNGAWEANWFWKINRVMDLKYAPAAGLPEGAMVRRPGPDPAPWTQKCFGPFELAGQKLRPHIGGGFWCPSGQSIALRETPVTDYADLATDKSVSASGALTVHIGRSGGFAQTTLGSGSALVWGVRMQSMPAEDKIVVEGLAKYGTIVWHQELSARRGTGDVALRLTQAQDGKFTAAPSGGGLAVSVPKGQGRFSFGNVPDSAVTFDLASLRLSS